MVFTSCDTKFITQELTVSGWNHLPNNEVEFSLGYLESKILEQRLPSYRKPNYSPFLAFTVKDGADFIGNINNSPYLVYKSDDNEFIYENEYVLFDNNNYYRIKPLTMYQNTVVINTFSLENCAAIYDIRIQVNQQYDIVSRFVFTFYFNIHANNYEDNELLTMYSWDWWKELYERIDEDICYIDVENKSVYLKSIDAIDSKNVIMTDFKNIKLSWLERSGKYYFTITLVADPIQS